MTNTDFLPQDYEAPKNGGNYLKFKDGETRFRILSKPVIGWLDWEDKKPLRFRMNEKPAKPVDPKKAIKHFWALVVWDYSENKIKVLEITQSSIQSAIQSLTKDEDWGSPFEYDIKVNRTGQDLETKYTVNPVPHKKMAKEITEALVSTPVNLQALFENEDPFAITEKTVPSDLPF